MSGGALRPGKGYGSLNASRFLCLRCRAGLCDMLTTTGSLTTTTVSMPSVSGGALRLGHGALDSRYLLRFYALGVGRALRRSTTECRAGLCDLQHHRRPPGVRSVSMPSVPGGALRQPWKLTDIDRAYLLEFLCPRCRAGLCDGPVLPSGDVKANPFLCPRCRAGLCDRRPHQGKIAHLVVSMPSVSGGALRRIAPDGTSDLRVWCPFRQPPVTGAYERCDRRRLASSIGLDLR